MLRRNFLKASLAAATTALLPFTASHAVSYTHLDVYKRQAKGLPSSHSCR